MAYEIPIEELQLKRHSVTLDCVIEIDDGGPGDWYIESITIKGFGRDDADLFFTSKDAMYHAIKESIMADPVRVAYIDDEARDNNTDSLARDPDWH